MDLLTHKSTKLKERSKTNYYKRNKRVINKAQDFLLFSLKNTRGHVSEMDVCTCIQFIQTVNDMKSLVVITWIHPRVTKSCTLIAFH